MIDEKILANIEHVEESCNIKSNNNETAFKVKKLKDGKTYSVTLGSTNAFKLRKMKACYRLTIKRSLLKNIDLTDGTITPKNTNDNAEIDFLQLTSQFYKLVELSLYDAVKNYQPENRFGCCSKYLECSNEGKCLHKDLLYAKGCWYRESVEKGNCFLKKQSLTK